MANITITIPDAIAVRCLNGVCRFYGYDTSNTTADKLAFAKAKIRESIINQTRQTEDAIARQAAADGLDFSELEDIS